MKSAEEIRIAREKRIHRILKVTNQVCIILIVSVVILWVDTRFILKDESLSLFFNSIWVFVSLVWIVASMVFDHRYNHCEVTTSSGKRYLCTCLIKDEKINWIRVLFE